MARWLTRKLYTKYGDRLLNRIYNTRFEKWFIILLGPTWREQIETLAKKSLGIKSKRRSRMRNPAVIAAVVAAVLFGIVAGFIWQFWFVYVPGGVLFIFVIAVLAGVTTYQYMQLRELRRAHTALVNEFKELKDTLPSSGTLGP